MSEQAQRDEDERDGLLDVSLDATTQRPLNLYSNLLNSPDTPPPQEKKKKKTTTEQKAPQLQPKRAQLLHNLLNAIPIASEEQITRMLQVFEPQNTQPASPRQGAPGPAPHPRNSTYTLPPRV